MSTDLELEALGKYGKLGTEVFSILGAGCFGNVWKGLQQTGTWVLWGSVERWVLKLSTNSELDAFGKYGKVCIEVVNRLGA